MSAAAARMERARLARYCLNSLRHDCSSRSSPPECVYHTLATRIDTFASTTAHIVTDYQEQHHIEIVIHLIAFDTHYGPKEIVVQIINVLNKIPSYPGHQRRRESRRSW